MTPARALRDKAEAEHAKHGGLGIATDASGDPVLVALATDRCACVVAIDKAEPPDWRSHIDMLKVIGIELREPSALEKLRRAR